ncbi:Solute carrier family 22 member [Zostera marina]|uniref:H(+)/Pi cotransporter n=1 Tax=Zostera marina TaxID=29655 RepID=A0A0K9NRR0_ZOSMR|nr:Solute carrier family 22 member [Zostera marina]
MAGEEDSRTDTGGGTIELAVDDIIEDHVGSFGLMQVVQVLLLSIARVFDSQITLVTIFSDAQPSWKCTGCSPDQDTSSSSTGMCGIKDGDWKWVGGDKSSTVSEWGLICDRKFRAGLPASMFFIGCIIGSGVLGRLADTFLGRKKAVVLTCLMTSVTAFLTSLSPNIWVYAGFRFLGGFSRAGVGICSLVLSTETVGRKWRGQVGQCGFFFFTMGFLSLPLVAYPTRTSWRKLYRILSLPPLLYSLLVLPFLSESPRWLAIRGRREEALRILKNYAKWNGNKMPTNVTIKPPLPPPSSSSTSENIWTTRWAARRMVLIMTTAFGIGLVYYGIQLNVENLNFNLYLTVAINALMEIPAVFFGGLFLSFMNRRVLFSSMAVMSAIACAVCIRFKGGNDEKEKKHSWPQMASEAVGFMAASTAYNVLYIYCVELFPTNVRNFAVSMLRQALMLGAAIAPELVVLGRVSPSSLFIIFAAFSLLSAFPTIWLPETRNSPLYETLDQQHKAENPERHQELVEITSTTSS